MSDSLVRVSRRVGPLRQTARSWGRDLRRGRAARRILSIGPAGRLPFPEEVACLLAGPASIVPTLLDESSGAKTERYACFQRFHVLFHFLFKVLFIFPSRYLFAIGLAQIFSFGWTLPPGWRCSPKQHDSREGFLVGATARNRAMTFFGSLSQQRIARGAR